MDIFNLIRKNFEEDIVVNKAIMDMDSNKKSFLFVFSYLLNLKNPYYCIQLLKIINEEDFFVKKEDIYFGNFSKINFSAVKEKYRNQYFELVNEINILYDTSELETYIDYAGFNIDSVFIIDLICSNNFSLKFYKSLMLDVLVNKKNNIFDYIFENKVVDVNFF